MDVEEIVPVPRSLWQNASGKRIISSIRRECVYHIIIPNENYLPKICVSFLDNYHPTRTRIIVGQRHPVGQSVQPVCTGMIEALPQAGGLHHRYERLAA